MRLQKKLLSIIAIAGCLAAVPVFAEEQYPVGTAVVIKHCDSIMVESNNPGIYHLNGTAVIFHKPGAVNLKIIARYGNNNAMVFRESFRIVPNVGLGNVKLTYNTAKDCFETLRSAR